MAPALSSQYAFRLVVGSPRSRSESRTAARPNVLVIHARQNYLFGFGKQKAAESETSESESPNNEKSRPFFLDYVPDAKSLVPVVGSSSTFFAGARRKKDPNTVFVAGATGQSGARITQMLLRQGFAVRAGVPELASAQELARMAATYKLISLEESKRLNAVVSSFSDPEAIAKAIGPAAKTVVAIGPSENGPDAAVTTDDALRLVLAAQLSGVNHVAIVYNSTPSSSSSSTYNVLGGISSFFSNLFPNSQKKQLSLSDFLDKVVETDVSSYTLVKAALTEDYSAESEHAVVVAEEGSATLGENKVSMSQIAKLVADVFSNTSVTENKVVQVSTSPSAAPKSISELFSAIPGDGRRKAYAEAIAKAKAEEEALVAAKEARETAEAAKKLEEDMKKKKKVSKQEVEAASLAQEARTKVEAAGFTLDNLLSKAKDFGDGGVGTNFSWEKLSSQLATAVSPKADGKSMTQVATIRGQVKARNLPPQKAVVKQTAPKSRPKQTEPKQPETKTEVRSVFGGLFKQETIYVDDDRGTAILACC